MQPRKLRSRPLLEATLGYEDLRDAVKAGGHALLALTGQAVTFKERAFVRFLANPAALDFLPLGTGGSAESRTRVGGKLGAGGASPNPAHERRSRRAAATLRALVSPVARCIITGK
jgi:hypothetical protein